MTIFGTPGPTVEDRRETGLRRAHVRGAEVDPGPPTIKARVAVACGVALAAAAIAAVRIRVDMGGIVNDLGYFVSAGKALLDGENPYRVGMYIYPLPAAVAAAPFSVLPFAWSAVLFIGLSMGFSAFALTREGYHRLPILMSFPALTAMTAGQWAPLILCAAFGSGWGWVAAIKPTLGTAMLARRMDWRGGLVAAACASLTLIIDPRWPIEWLRAMLQFSGVKMHHIPALVPGGVLLLLAAIRWRTESGRLLLAMSLIPQSMFFYDQLALGLLAQTFRQSLICALWSYAVMLLAYMCAPSGLNTLPQNAAYLSRIIVWGYYLPALAWVLWTGRRHPVIRAGL
jgi:hypothetical protein